MRVRSPGREESVDDTFPTLHLGGPSEQDRWPQLRQQHSADSTNEERNLVSYVDIMNEAEDVGSPFQGDESRFNLWLGKWFSNESSEMEYSFVTEVSNSTSSP